MERSTFNAPELGGTFFDCARKSSGRKRETSEMARLLGCVTGMGSAFEDAAAVVPRQSSTGVGGFSRSGVSRVDVCARDRWEYSRWVDWTQR